jgi:hypothetical protein
MNNANNLKGIKKINIMNSVFMTPSVKINMKNTRTAQKIKQKNDKYEIKSNNEPIKEISAFTLDEDLSENKSQITSFKNMLLEIKF